MSGRRYGFLWDDEREYISAHVRSGPNSYPHDETELTWDEWVEQHVKEEIDNPRQIKSRIKNDAASYTSLRDALVTFREDLSEVRNFYTEVLDQPGGRYEFLDYRLPMLKDEIGRLREQLERWEEWAEQQSEFSDSARDDIGRALAPLHLDLSMTKQVQEEGPSSDLRPEYRKALNRADDANPKFVAELEERSKRRKALAVLLGNDDLRELFEYIADHPGQKLPSNTIGNNPWAWWSSTKLRNEHGLVEKSAWGYELTPRGYLVKESLDRFEQTDVFGPFEEDADYEWTLHLLRLFHADDAWNDA